MLLDIPISDPDSMADWVELYAAVGEAAISKSEVCSAIEEGKELEPGESSINDVWQESLVDDVWLELERRESLYGEDPPFIFEKRRIVPNIDWDAHPEYLVCLLLSILGNRENPTVTGKLFERLSSEAIKNYLGGRTIIYGHPSKQKVQNIADQLCERFISEPSSNFKDRGLDVIGWKPFGDERASQVVVLFQCAAGDNWKDKLLRMPLDAWCGDYIMWRCNPIRGFVLPHMVSRSEFWDCSRDAGIIIDRARIYRNTLYFTFEDGLRDQLRDWCCHTLSDLRRSY